MECNNLIDFGMGLQNALRKDKPCMHGKEEILESQHNEKNYTFVLIHCRGSFTLPMTRKFTGVTSAQ